MTSPPSVHRLYGLHVRSSVPLHQNRPVDGVAPDVVIDWGAPRDIPFQVPEGTLLVRFAVEDQLRYAFATDKAGRHVLRFCGTCDFVVSSDLRSVTAHPAPDIDAGLVSVLATGTVLSFVLAMRGEPVLHASAVEICSSVVAFVGYSGMGKSTMAALMCAAGGRLITDDVLRVDLADDMARCHLGATELRLRKAAAELAATFSEKPPTRQTSDDRAALRPEESMRELLPLRAIVIPMPSHDRSSVSVQAVAGAEALLTLVRFPRILGWESPAVEARQFAHAAQLVERVPVYLAELPWGPPFPSGVAEQLLAELGLSVQDQSTAQRAYSDAVTLDSTAALS